MENTDERIFDEWNSKKKHVHAHGVPKHVRPGEIWWSDIGKNIGFEQDGGSSFERPFLIICQINYHLALGVPLTSQPKNEGSSFYYRLVRARIPSTVVIPQLRVMSTKRMHRFIERLDTDELSAIIIRIKTFFKF